MKALTLTQPWATLVAIGAKRYETRGWRTHYRGPLAIHAGKGLAPVGGMRGLRAVCAAEPFREALNEAGFADPADLPRGVIVATCILEDCIPTDQLTNGMLGTWERAFGDYSPGRYGWRLRGVEPTPLISATGKLGLWVYRPASAPATTDDRTTVIHKRDSRPGDVYIGRPSKWGNPFVIGSDGDRDEVISRYRYWIEDQPELLAALSELRGKRLVCFCKPKACHGDVLAELANGQVPNERTTQ